MSVAFAGTGAGTETGQSYGVTVQSGQPASAISVAFAGSKVGTETGQSYGVTVQSGQPASSTSVALAGTGAGTGAGTEAGQPYGVTGQKGQPASSTGVTGPGGAQESEASVAGNSKVGAGVAGSEGASTVAGTRPGSPTNGSSSGQATVSAQLQANSSLAGPRLPDLDQSSQSGHAAGGVSSGQVTSSIRNKACNGTCIASGKPQMTNSAGFSQPDYQESVSSNGQIVPSGQDQYSAGASAGGPQASNGAINSQLGHSQNDTVYSQIASAGLSLTFSTAIGSQAPSAAASQSGQSEIEGLVDSDISSVTQQASAGTSVGASGLQRTTIIAAPQSGDDAGRVSGGQTVGPTLTQSQPSGGTGEPQGQGASNTTQSESLSSQHSSGENNKPASQQSSLQSSTSIHPTANAHTTPSPGYPLAPISTILIGPTCDNSTTDPLSNSSLVAPLTRTCTVQSTVESTLRNQTNITAFSDTLSARLHTRLDEYIASQGYGPNATEVQKPTYVGIDGDLQQLGSRTCKNLTKTEENMVRDIYFAEMIVNATYAHYQQVRGAVEVGDCRAD